MNYVYHIENYIRVSLTFQSILECIRSTFYLVKNKIRIIALCLLISFFGYAQEDYIINQLGVKDGLAHNNIYEIFEDRDGFLWIGAGSKLQRFDGHNFITFEYIAEDSNSLVFGDIMSISQDYSGAIWVGTDGGGLSRFKNGQFRSFKSEGKDNSISNNSVEVILTTPDSSLWIGTWGGGINLYKNGQFSLMPMSSGNTNDCSKQEISALFFDENTETLWIGTWKNGLYSLQKGVKKHFPIEPGSYNSISATSISRTDDGTIWIGSWGSGLFRYKDGRFEQYTAEAGHLGGNNINSVKADGNALWVGTYGGGITFYKNETFDVLKINENIASEHSLDYIESSIIDRNGNYWVATSGAGLAKLERHNKEGDYNPHVQITHLSVADSLIFSISQTPSPKIFGEDPLRIDPNEENISIYFSDMKFGNSFPTYFKHKLSRHHTSWSEASQNSFVSFKHLKPGSYTFEVMASIDQVNWSEPAHIHLIIETLWYQTLTFKLLILAFIILITIWLIRLRLLLLAKRNNLFKQIVDEKTSEIQLKNKQISDHALTIKQANEELQIALEELKHFQRQKEVFVENEKSVISRELHDNISTTLFSVRQRVNNALNKIEGKTTQAVRLEVDEMIKNVIEDSRVIVKNLSSKPFQHATFYDSLKDLIDNIRLISDCDIKLNWEGSYHISDLKVSLNLFRIIKEALSNSVKHAKANKITVSINNSDQVTCTVEDDGKGFDQDRIRQSKGGIQNILDRAEELNAGLEIKSELNKGTLLKITIEQDVLVA